MVLPPGLRTDLATLADASRPDVDLEAMLDAVARSATGAVASYVGLTITIAADEHQISLTTRDSSASVGASLAIPLAHATAGAGGCTVVLYAGKPGAFVDLAADLSRGLGVELAALVLDDRLGSLPDGPGLDEYSSFNQAIGALIERGYTPEAAQAQLRQRAEPGQDRPRE